MQKLINQPQQFVTEMLEGVLAAHGDTLVEVADRVLVRAASPIQGKVSIVTGGGSGHLPLFLGYVGDRMADGVAVGEVFASPSAVAFHEAARATDGGAGVLYLIGNYGGDRMNVDMAVELATEAGIEAAVVLGTDDIASAPRAERSRRRGVAGILFAFKAAGAVAAKGGDLAQVAAAAEHAVARSGTMSVGLGPCILPEVGRPTFDLEPGQMEIGVGIHGEPGIRRGALEPADRVTDTMVDALLEDLAIADGDSVAVLVNGLGATPPEELYVLYRRIAQRLAQRSVGIAHRWIGEYATSLEMSGASVSLLHLDPELDRLLAVPARTPFFALS